jgi:hypothetical protein
MTARARNGWATNPRPAKRMGNRSESGRETLRSLRSRVGRTPATDSRGMLDSPQAPVPEEVQIPGVGRNREEARKPDQARSPEAGIPEAGIPEGGIPEGDSRARVRSRGAVPGSRAEAADNQGEAADNQGEVGDSPGLTAGSQKVRCPPAKWFLRGRARSLLSSGRPPPRRSDYAPSPPVSPRPSLTTARAARKCSVSSELFVCAFAPLVDGIT